MCIQLLPHTKFYLKCIIDLNVKAKTIKLYEENIREKIHNFQTGEDFLRLNTKNELAIKKRR